MLIAATICAWQSEVIAQNQTLTPREIARRTLPSVVHIVTTNAQGKPESQGSGFFIGIDTIATNYHVIEGGSTIRVKPVGLKHGYVPAEIFGFDSTKDLALLKVKNIKGIPLSIVDTRNLAIGDTIYAVGNPEGLEGTFSQGIISNLRDKSYIQITAPISHGSSGGPVLNHQGKVIAIATATIEDSQNLNFAIPALQVLALSNRVKAGQRSDLPMDLSKLDEKAKSDYFLMKAGGFLRKHQFNEAIESYKEAIRFDSSNAGAHMGLGATYNLLGQPQESIFYLRKAITISPNFTEAYWYLGNGYLRSGQIKEAVETYQRAIRLRPDYVKAHFNLGVAYGKLGLQQDAIAAYKQAIRFDPDYALAHYHLALLFLASDDKASAIEEYKILRKLDPAKADKLFNLIYP